MGAFGGAGGGGEAPPAVVHRTGRPSSARIAPPVSAPPAGAAPNAPNRTFAIERFIAFDMRRVRVVPDAPTSGPATMRSWLPGTKPAAATARAGNAFRGAETTGKAGPTIRMTKAVPKRRTKIAAA